MNAENYPSLICTHELRPILLVNFELWQPTYRNHSGLAPAVQEAAKNNSGGGAKRTSPFWTVFNEDGCDAGSACCTVVKDNGEICGKCISTVGGPTAMKNHCMYKHPDKYIELMPPSEKLNLKLDPQTKLLALPAYPHVAVPVDALSVVIGHPRSTPQSGGILL